MDEQTGVAIPPIDRWTMIRDIGVLQVKLIVDGLRDFLFVPASLVVGAVSLLGGRDGSPAPHFYRLLAIGKQSERAINLFGAYRHSPEQHQDLGSLGDVSIDDLVDRMENFVVDEYKRGGVTAAAKKKIDDALDTIQRAARSGQRDSSKDSRT